MTTGGSILSVNIAGRNFAATADNDVARKLGGYNNEVQANGDGSARKVMTREPHNFEGIVLNCDNDRGDQEFLQDVANNPEFVPVAISTVDGNVYQGRSTIVGDLTYNTMSATANISLSGPDRLTRQL